jgi:hypothetical protein
VATSINQSLQRLLYSGSPAARARRYFWIKIAVSLAYYAVWVLILMQIEPWFERHAFISAITAIIAFVGWFAFVVAWHFRVSCPNCGWNINVATDKYGMVRNNMFVPSSCPSCGADLTAEPKRSAEPPSESPKQTDVVLKTLLHSDGKRRVLIKQRRDRLFSFEEEKLKQHYDDQMAARLNDWSTSWFPVGGRLTICDSQEAAQREARSSIPWLREIESP